MGVFFVISSDLPWRGGSEMIIRPLPFLIADAMITDIYIKKGAGIIKGLSFIAKVIGVSL